MGKASVSCGFSRTSIQGKWALVNASHLYPKVVWTVVWTGLSSRVLKS